MSDEPDDICPVCEGHGWIPLDPLPRVGEDDVEPWHFVTCEACLGLGEIIEV